MLNRCIELLWTNYITTLLNQCKLWSSPICWSVIDGNRCLRVQHRFCPTKTAFNKASNYIWLSPFTYLYPDQLWQKVYEIHQLLNERWFSPDHNEWYQKVSISKRANTLHFQSLSYKLWWQFSNPIDTHSSWVKYHKYGPTFFQRGFIEYQNASRWRKNLHFAIVDWFRFGG